MRVSVWGALAATLAASVGCSETPAPGASMETRSDGVERADALGEFLTQHWRLPVPLQGEAPPEYNPLEASLHPEQCGSCHPQQYAEWRTSLHAGAYSPGLAGQLIEGSLSTPKKVRSCQRCHTPLAEQLALERSGEANLHFDPELRSQGLVCAGCHVRAHRRLGPPRRAELGPVPEGIPHGGFEARAEFQEARFCATCHQFFDDPGVNGKPVENTFREWQASRFAAEGRTCQACHMPGRAHTWRGIHDADFVRAAVDVALEPAATAGATLAASLVLTSRDVGHAFPTYVTPRVVLAVFQVDADGDEIPDTRAEAVIGRKIDFATSPSQEIFDTRVAPGEAFTLDYAEPRAQAARGLVGRVTVDPAHHYRGVFASLLRRYETPEARALIESAHARAQETPYTLAELRTSLPALP